MTTLRITVEWLDGAYHGREWPPSPSRLYQAMLAGYAVHQRGNPILEAAMRHLETLPPPTITAPLTDAQEPVTSCVPNNDGDWVLAPLAAGKPAAARSLRRKSVTLRTRCAQRFDGRVTYDWPATPATAGHLPAIATIAACVSAVGLGIDVAVADAALLTRPSAARGIRHTPSPTAQRTLDIPYPGAFDDLEKRYRALRARMGSNTLAPVREPPPRAIGYACELDLPQLRCAGFALRTPDDRPLGVDGTRTMEVAAMVRHAIGRAARRARLEQTTVCELMGHGSDDRRLWVQPLPNAGYRHADGRIRRVMLTAAPGVDEGDWSDVLSRLPGEPLVSVEQQIPIGALAPLASPDPMMDRFLGEAKRWTTATPVVLPGLDSRRGKPRPQRLVRRLLRHAGIAESLVERVTMEPAPRLAGSDRPARYRRPRHLARYPCQHMSLQWKMPVTGPLALGAGIGYGLGLFMPTHD